VGGRTVQGKRDIFAGPKNGRRNKKRPALGRAFE
jgi:hypothetical protein